MSNVYIRNMEDFDNILNSCFHLKLINTFLPLVIKNLNFEILNLNPKINFDLLFQVQIDRHV